MTFSLYDPCISYEVRCVLYIPDFFYFLSAFDRLQRKAGLKDEGYPLVLKLQPSFR